MKIEQFSSIKFVGSMYAISTFLSCLHNICIIKCNIKHFSSADLNMHQSGFGPIHSTLPTTLFETILSVVYKKIIALLFFRDASQAFDMFNQYLLSPHLSECRFQLSTCVFLRNCQFIDSFVNPKRFQSSSVRKCSHFKCIISICSHTIRSFYTVLKITSSQAITDFTYLDLLLMLMS